MRLFIICLLLSVNAVAQPITIGKSYQLNSKILDQKRTINVYLPPEYDSTKTFPVIYLLDGGMDEDFLHVCGLVQYVSRPWINYLPPTIVVGIASVDRKKDFTPPAIDTAYQRIIPQSGGAKNFMEFLEKELKPYISKNFHVNESSTLIGESLGGLMATQVLLNKPDLFSHYVIVSPSLWWNNAALLNESAVKPTKRSKVFIAVETQGEVPGPRKSTMWEDAEKLLQKLRSIPRISPVMVDMMNETHATILHPALMKIFKNWNTKNSFISEVAFSPSEVQDSFAIKLENLNARFEAEGIHLSQEQLSSRFELVDVQEYKHPEFSDIPDTVQIPDTVDITDITQQEQLITRQDFENYELSLKKRLPKQLVHDKEKAAYVRFYSEYEKIFMQYRERELLVNKHQYGSDDSAAAEQVRIELEWRKSYPDFLIMEQYMSPTLWKEAEKMQAKRGLIDTLAQRVLDELYRAQMDSVTNRILKRAPLAGWHSYAVYEPYIDPERWAFIRNMNLMLLHGKRLKAKK